jgi:hypothetical protein
MATIQQELEDELVNHRDRVLVISGAGVTIATTERNASASWLGLLRNGVEYCATHCPGLPGGWAERMQAQLDQGDVVEMISVAEDLSARLGFPDGGEYARWLTETVGSLRVKSPELLKALGDWGVQIATTNYDELHEEVTGRRPITWMDRGRTATTPGPPVRCLGPDGSEQPGTPTVPPNEGNEVRRDGRRLVGAPHSTVEPGRPNMRAPWGGKGAPRRGTVGGKHGGCLGTRSRVHETTTDSCAGLVGEAPT